MLAYSYDDDKRDTEKLLLHLDIVENAGKLMNELPLHNIHEKFYVFCYLLWNGYFSVEHTYTYSDVIPPDERNTIFLGRGCCRHNADLMKDVFKELDYDSSGNPMNIYLGKTKLKPLMDIKKTTEAYTPAEKEDPNETNHRIYVGPFFREDKALFLFDPTILTECEILTGGRIHCFNGKYQVNESLIKKNLNYAYTFDRKYNLRPTLTEKQLKEFYAFAKQVCIEYGPLFNDFFAENQPKYEKMQGLILK